MEQLGWGVVGPLGGAALLEKVGYWGVLSGVIASSYFFLLCFLLVVDM